MAGITGTANVCAGARARRGKVDVGVPVVLWGVMPCWAVGWPGLGAPNMGCGQRGANGTRPPEMKFPELVRLGC